MNSNHGPDALRVSSFQGEAQKQPVARNVLLLEKTFRPLEAKPILVEPLVGVENSAPAASTPASRLRSRHKLVLISLALAILPGAATSVYMASVAADQFHSSASFSVRSIDAAQPSDILGMFSQSSGGSTVSDSYALIDYILSERMVEAVDQSFDLSRLFAQRGGDFFYALQPDLPIEEKLAYWRDMVSVTFDHTSDIMTVTVKAFQPTDSQQIASFIMQRSELLINELSASARDEVLVVAKREVALAETRLSESRSALRIYRSNSQEADPIESAKLATQLVGTLEQQLVQLRAKLSTALTEMDEASPRVRLMRSEIDSVEKQIAEERQRFGSGRLGNKADKGSQAGSADVAGRFQEYETLETSREFAERAYTSALAGLEKARIEAAGKQRYLAAFIKPTLSQKAQYPSRLVNSVLMLLGGLMTWGVAVMAFYNIRDRN
jgi:capsular polysaccharide transport system permease protein